MKLFGFEIVKSQEEVANNFATQTSFAPPQNDDGALNIAGAPYYATYVDMDATAKNEVELITRYREMAMQPEIESAIEDILNEAIVQDDDGQSVKIVLDEVDGMSDAIKTKIVKEFDNVLNLLNYREICQDLFKRWYVDGRIFFHVIIDQENPKKGIVELRYVDPRKIKKIRELQKVKDPATGVDMIITKNEYYVYNERVNTGMSGNPGSAVSGPIGIRIATDSIINVNSGLMDSRRMSVLSYLHKAIKPLNQLRMMEDATVIYTISRAPERRIFYVDVGNLPKVKAEQYLRDIMTKYKNKVTYDATTGEVRDDRRFQSMLEDFWMPRREGGKGTEITTLPGAQSLTKMENVEYFERKLYKSLSVPVGRLDPSQSAPAGIGLGRTAEVTRDEIKFDKFIQRLRNKFSAIFNQAMRVQVVLKGICSAEEWDAWKEQIYYDYLKDNNFAELKESELMKERLALLSVVDPYVGKYYSIKYVTEKILRLTDEEMKEMKKQMKKEAMEAALVAPPPDQGEMNNDGSFGDPNMDQGNPAQDQQAAAEQQMQGDKINKDVAALDKVPRNPMK